MLVSALIEIVCKMALAYQVQFLQPLSEPLNLLAVEVGGNADLVARLVAHLHGDSNFRICKKKLKRASVDLMPLKMTPSAEKDSNCCQSFQSAFLLSKT